MVKNLICSRGALTVGSWGSGPPLNMGKMSKHLKQIEGISWEHITFTGFGSDEFRFSIGEQCSKPGLVGLGDFTTQLYRDSNKP